MSTVFDSIPDISFIGSETLESLLAQMVSDYCAKFKEVTGNEITLSLSSPWRLLLYTCALRQYQSDLCVDYQGKQNMLKYSTGDDLDNLGALMGVTRNAGSKAQTTERFTLSAAQPSVISIPQGATVTNGTVYFKTTEYAEIAIGSTYIDVPCECTAIGTSGNGFTAGEINSLVTSIPYIASVTNLTTTSNGTEIEDDDSLRERIYLASSAYSVAGPEDAYIYLVKSYSSKIADVKVTNPSPVHVDIRVILDGAELPDSDFIAGLTDYISTAAKTRRPLTDLVEIAAPTTTAYNVSVTYYINESDKSIATSIQTAVEAAVASYVTWQGTKIGRDINPDELTKLMKQAGAKRVVITSPAYTVVADTDIPKIGTKTVTYGGLEDD